MNVRDGHEWDKFEGLAQDPAALQAFLADVPFNRDGRRRHDRASDRGASARNSSAGADLDPDRVRQDPRRHRQDRQRTGRRIVTTSPDVTVSTNLGTWVNRRDLFAARENGRCVPEGAIPAHQNWDFTPEGQHIELGIAEMNLFS